MLYNNTTGSNIVARALYGMLCLTAALPLTVGSTNAASTESVVYRFPAGAGGYFPTGRLVEDAHGALYGTTALGGLMGKGTIFKFVPPTETQKTGQLTVLYFFSGTPYGALPQGSLALGANGVLYGTTPDGGNGAGDGTIFAVQPPTAAKPYPTGITIHQFNREADGNAPAPGLLIGNNGTLYGAISGGASGFGSAFGSIFAFVPAKNQTVWTEKILYAFKGGADGLTPNGSLISDISGALYGTTLDTAPVPNAARSGTIFKLTPPPAGKTAWTRTILYRFKGTTDGSIPTAPLLRDGKGALYGTTKGGNGTVFKLSPPAAGKTVWTLATLYSFKGGADGQTPSSGVVVDKTGALTGTTLKGGATGHGTVFKLTPPKTATGKWTKTVLHSFAGGTDGNNPASVLISPSGSLFGVTNYGGNTGCASKPYPGGCGTIFKLTE